MGQAVSEHVRDGVSVLEPPPGPRPADSRPPARPRPRRAAFLGRLARGVPTALVLAALGGLAYWGHHTGWTLPPFAALTGTETQEKDDWCAAHAVPESV